MSTREFEHYTGCRGRDPDNCSGCALTHGGKDGPNYSSWPLAYIQNNRTIPAKWRKAFERELQSDNKAYADNIRAQVAKHGVRFSDAGPYESAQVAMMTADTKRGALSMLRATRINGTARTWSIVSTDTGGLIATCDYEDKAQAIVRACNSHNDLLAALQAMIDAINAPHSTATALALAGQQARAAIARATEGSEK